MNKKSFALIPFSLLFLTFAYYCLLRRIEPFVYQFYLLAWWSYICLLDGILSFRAHRLLVLNGDLPFLVIASTAFWCVFELINVRLQNWFYIAIPESMGLRFSGYFVAFGTVIPAIYLTYELADRVLPKIRVAPLSLKGYPSVALPLGLACLVFAFLFPTHCFALAWVFLAFLVDGYNYHARNPSFAGSIEEGDLKPLVAAGLSGMICGLLWEFWNYWSICKWVYTVPFFENMKLFEMPAPGFLGFAFFALEVMAFLSLLRATRALSRKKWVLAAVALPFCLVSFFFIDHYTVFSHTALVDELPFLTDSDRAAVEATGAETIYAMDPRLLTDHEKERLALIEMKGLGLDKYLALSQHGIETIERLSQLDQNELSSIIRETNMRRVRVYLSAARLRSRSKVEGQRSK